MSAYETARSTTTTTASEVPPPIAEPAPAASGFSLDGFLGGLSGVGSAIGDTLSGIGGAISDGLGGLFGATPETPTESTPRPAQPAPRPSAQPTPEAPAAATSGSPEFLSQRDNKFNKGGVSAENMCTVTSLAMQLIALCGGADAVKQETAALITAKGGAPPEGAALTAAQTEDVLMTFFDLLAQQGYWDQFTKSTKPPFYGNWRNDVPDGTKFHQAGACQAHVLSMYRGIKSSNVSRVNAGCATIQEFLEKHVKPEMDRGVTFAMSTRLTSGHFVTLVEVRPGDGLVIHDPYGAKTSAGHLKNGSDAKWLASNGDAMAELKVRFRDNPALLAALADPATALPNWGERNFFTWPEVERWKIGDYGTAAGR